MGDFWVFGYGSLMWRPGFDYVEAQRARLSGYRRTLCIRSHVYRGTPERPGLVLGLEHGGSCLGMAFRVEGGRAEEVMAYLRAREMTTNVYHEKRLPVRLDTGVTVRAISYVADRKHQQYVGGIGPDEMAQTIAGATGEAGANEDYVLNTIAHLRELGIRDRWLEGIAARLSAPSPAAPRPAP
ncbi:MAG: gamma-glutamylcyclotransferase [Aquamicrobium sp.]|uniref:gamma-glutamylcyclotransferase n=1 Tax=Aquamicrobium sp. TaxID=1872579 RepID=UPI00349E59C9|nr:gamma-glutamylcyclotransferase [Aquamicrobium sp.]